MDEMGLPGAAAPPPSYLRPPRMPSNRAFLDNKWLFFTTGMAVIVISLLTFQVKDGSLFLLQDTPQGMVALISESSPRLSWYRFSDDSLKPITLPEQSELIRAVFSPGGTTFAAVLVSEKESAPFVILAGANGKRPITMASAGAGVLFSNLVVAEQVPAILYSVSESFVSAKTEADHRAGRGVSTTAERLALSTLKNGKPESASLAFTSDPLLFVPNVRAFIAREGTGLAIVPFEGSDKHVIQGVTTQGKVLSVAYSGDASEEESFFVYLADGLVNWGSMHWGSETFTLLGSSSAPGARRVFMSGNHLLIATDSQVTEYSLQGSSLRKVSSARIPAGTQVLSWSNPPQNP